MRRLVPATAALAAVVALSAQGASTAGAQVPTSTAGYQAVTVTGAVNRGTSYTVAGGTVTTVRQRLRGTSLLFTTVRARYGDGPTVVCTPGVLQLLNLLTGLREGTWTCGGFAEPASRPRPLVITVS